MFPPFAAHLAHIPRHFSAAFAAASSTAIHWASRWLSLNCLRLEARALHITGGRRGEKSSVFSLFKCGAEYLEALAVWGAVSRSRPPPPPHSSPFHVGPRCVFFIFFIYSSYLPIVLHGVCIMLGHTTQIAKQRIRQKAVSESFSSIVNCRWVQPSDN